MNLEITRATLSNLDDLVPLFDAYRQFYEQTTNLETAKIFLKERIENQESVIFLAFDDKKAIGFTQLYPSFSSVSMEKLWILNDLFVLPDFRDQKVGEGLLETAKKFTQDNNAKGLALETAENNPAQFLYERLGWQKDEGFYHYFWKNNVEVRF